MRKARGCYFKVGTKKLREDGVNYPLRHARFCMDEAGLKTGAAAWLAILTKLEDRLNKKEDT